MSVPTFLSLKNSANRARWMWRWHLQGGSPFIRARDLQDLRDADGLRRWRAIEFKVASIRQPAARVVCINAERTKRRANVAKIKFEKARRSAK